MNVYAHEMKVEANFQREKIASARVGPCIHFGRLCPFSEALTRSEIKKLITYDDKIGTFIAQVFTLFIQM